MFKSQSQSPIDSGKIQQPTSFGALAMRRTRKTDVGQLNSVVKMKSLLTRCGACIECKRQEESDCGAAESAHVCFNDGFVSGRDCYRRLDSARDPGNDRHDSKIRSPESQMANEMSV